MRRILRYLTWAQLRATFGNQENIEIAEQLRELMAAARECSTKLSREIELHESDMVGAEHRGDAALQRVEEALERAFNLRFGKADPTRLAHELDDVTDGMRGVARHVETYAKFLAPFPESSRELIEAVQQGVENLAHLVNEVLNGRIDRERVRTFADTIIDLESRADVIRARAEQALVADSAVTDFRAFLAITGLNDLLERVTDHSKHCAVNLLSIARQEA